MMPDLEISLLGPFGVRLAGQVVTPFATTKIQALLAYLAVEADHPHLRSRLAGLLWPEQPEPGAQMNLRQSLRRLRQTLPPAYLLATRQTLQFNPNSDYHLDVTHFTELITICRRHSHPDLTACQDCLIRLRQAVELYRGDFLAEFFLADNQAFEEWALLKREWLRRETLQALYLLAASYEQQGDYEIAVSYARRQVALDPLREEAHRQLMRALALSGRRAEALAQYKTCRQILADELMIEPSGETKALYEAIQSEKIGRWGEKEMKGEIKISSPPAHNLPIPLMPLLGREQELVDLARLLSDPGVRLLTLIGLGGIGKTHLAIEAARNQFEQFPHGVYFVSLAPLESPEAIIVAAAKALNFSLYEKGNPQQQLCDYLRQKWLLLVLDNFEHLLDPPSPLAGGIEGGTALVIDWLQAAPGLKILITSRARLNIQGEQLFPLEGIDFPHKRVSRLEGWNVQTFKLSNVETFEPANVQTFKPSNELATGHDLSRYSAVQLFLQAARRIRPDFELTDDQAPAVGQICRLLQGMPLGILLAAAWIELLSPSEIAVEIGRSLDFLESNWRDLPERQCSLRAVFDHSWGLLTERERVVFQQASIFRGGFTYEAARAVMGASRQELRAMVNKSLLRPPLSSPPTGEIEGGTETGRYEIHELLRQYGAEKLAQTPTVEAVSRDRHSAYYCAFLQGREADLKGVRHQLALAKIEADHENIRLAWDWAAAQKQLGQLAEAVDSLGIFYELRGYYRQAEIAYDLAAKQLTAVTSGDGLRLLTKLFAWQSHFSQGIGRTELSGQLLSKSWALLSGPELANRDTQLEKAFIFLRMGYKAVGSDRQEAKRMFGQSLELYRALDEPWWIVRALGGLAWIARQSGAYAEAREWTEECLAICRRLGQQGEITDLLDSLGFSALQQGQLEEGERLIRESNLMCQRLGQRPGIGRGYRNLGVTLVLLGQFAEGYARLEEARAICDDLGIQSGLVFLRTWSGLAQMHLGRYNQARRQAEEGLTLAREADHRGIMGNALFVLGCVGLVEAAYSEAHQALQESVAMYRELGQSHELSVTLAALGYAERGLGNMAQSQGYLCQALQAVETHAFYPLVLALPAVALLLAGQGQQEKAVELYALASHFPYVANSRWFEDVAGRRIAAAAAGLPPEVRAAAQERGRARDLWETAAELLADC